MWFNNHIFFKAHLPKFQKLIINFELATMHNWILKPFIFYDSIAIYGQIQNLKNLPLLAKINQNITQNGTKVVFIGKISQIFLFGEIV